jgi:imidazoleglycerol phosphate synthase glutamine amidotransferase subunit HisH
MQVSIYKPCKSAMQSGMGNFSKWVVEFPHDQTALKEPIMGWTSSSNTQKQIKLSFSSKEAAVKFATDNELEYEVIEAEQKKMRIRTYAENFK